MKSILALLILLLLIMVTPTRAQNATPSATPTFSYGVHINGTLNDGTPSVLYNFGGLRGDVISIDLTVNSGDLDPMITLMDSKGAVLALTDDANLQGRSSRDLHLDSLHIPHSDTYSLVVGRFGYGFGTTSGTYTLEVDRIGVSSDSGSALRYGDSVYNTITDGSPEVYYTFRAARGDVISVKMQRASGDLDPALQIVNSDSLLLAQNDDSPGTLDAAVNGFIIRQDGVYVIIASRFGEAAGKSKGSFVLTLNSAAESGLGKSIDLAIPLLSGAPVQGQISDQQISQFYSFDGHKDDVVTIRMGRSSGNLDAFLSLLDASQREITNDDDSGGGQNAMINQFILPADGTYTIEATRFKRDQGDTSGPYQLEMDIIGNLAASLPANVPRIQYGSSVTGTINDATPQAFYAFIARQGDHVTVVMDNSGGNLDPRVAILNPQQKALALNDDSGGSQNAKIDDFTVPSTGVYFILATRYGGSDGDAHTSGMYTLSLTLNADANNGTGQ